MDRPGDEGSWTARFIRQSWLVLLLATLSAGVLAVLERSLQPRIQQVAERRLLDAVLDVVPGGTANRRVELEGKSAYLVEDAEGRARGWAVPVTANGFVDKIELLVGVSLDGSRILGLAVLRSKETPGLGDRIRDESFREQFRGLPATVELVVVKPGQSAPHAVDAITGATVSTWAVVRGITDEIEQMRPRLANAAAERISASPPTEADPRGG